MRFAYQEPFTPDNIITAFEPRGLYPVDRKKLLPVSRPNDMKDIRNLISVKNWSLHLFWSVNKWIEILLVPLVLQKDVDFLTQLEFLYW